MRGIVIPSVIALAICVVPALVAQPIITFEADRVLVSGITPGVGAAVLSVSREPAGWSERVFPVAEAVRDTGSVGEIEIPLERGLAWKSIWAAVDGYTGEFTVSAPDDFPLREIAFDSEGGIRPGPTGEFNRILAEHQTLHVLVVRPRVAAWHAVVSDGGPADDDGGYDGRVRVNLRSAENLTGNNQQFLRLAENDVVIGIDPSRLEFFAFRLAD